jgi:hypothetical protein
MSSAQVPELKFVFGENTGENLTTRVIPADTIVWTSWTMNASVNANAAVAGPDHFARGFGFMAIMAILAISSDTFFTHVSKHHNLVHDLLLIRYLNDNVTVERNGSGNAKSCLGQDIGGWLEWDRAVSLNQWDTNQRGTEFARQCLNIQHTAEGQ